MRIRVATLADAPAIARVHVDSWRTSYKDIVPEGFLASLSYEDRETMWRGALSRSGSRSVICVAEADDGHIVGFAAGGPAPSSDTAYTGQLYAIYLLDDWQRQGIGRQLIATVVGQLVHTGFASLLVWVLAENPSRRFYEALGGEYVREQGVTIGGAELVEVAYGWLDARTSFDVREQQPSP